jgi:hypothetical protein
MPSCLTVVTQPKAGSDKLREYAKGCFVEKVSCLVDLVDSKLNPILNSENMP